MTSSSDLFASRPLEITRKAESASRQRDDGTMVRYYVFDEFEIHDDELPPATVQEWHHHERIDEVLYVVSGILEVKWLDGSSTRAELLHAGDAVRVGTAAHTVANPTDASTRFVVFRMVPAGIDRRETIRNDKVLDGAPTADDRGR
jgi:uncharacterized cupin superfamily protein